MQISKTQARLFLLKYQYLLPPRKLKNPKGILDYISRVGCIQYDPLNMVGRNSDLVLQSRCMTYKTEYLYDLLYNARKLVDYWDKCMSILPVEDWPYFKRIRNDYNKQYEKRKDILDKAKKELVKMITEKGVINSSALNSNKKVDWGWSPTNIIRAALESMFHSGELIIHHKKGTRKYYSFPKNHIPEKIFKGEDPNKKHSDYFKWYVLRRISSIGLLWNRAGDAWLGIRDLKSDIRNKAILELLEEEKLLEVTINDTQHNFYIPAEYNDLMDDLKHGNEASVIAPLDNLIWDRKLIRELFNFDYKWEVYTPASKRKYGYYVLPVLYGDSFIARFEPVLDKNKKTLVIKNWWWEPEIKYDSYMSKALSSCLNAFLKYTGMDNIKLENKGCGNMEWVKGVKPS